MGADLTERQRMALAVAQSAQNDNQRTEEHLARVVRNARAAGVPILTLANALGVSRSRVRILARDTINKEVR